AWTTRRIIGVPPTAWRTLGRTDCIRTPRPPAKMIAAADGARGPGGVSAANRGNPSRNVRQRMGAVSGEGSGDHGCGARIRTWDKGSKVPCDTASPLRINPRRRYYQNPGACQSGAAGARVRRRRGDGAAIGSVDRSDRDADTSSELEQPRRVAVQDLLSIVGAHLHVLKPSRTGRVLFERIVHGEEDTIDPHFQQTALQRRR